MIRVVLDSNIFISSIFWSGSPYEVFKRGILGNYKIVISSEILNEVVDKLRYKFKFPEENILNLVDILLTHSEMIQTKSKLDIVRDKEDNKIVECAFDGNADYIVTGDSDLLVLEKFENIKIIKANEFLRILENN